jgi:hypothetical protein
VTVEELDQFGNILTNDSSGQVTLAFGANPGSATLGGTLTETVSKGIATFSNLSVNAAANGYTLVASEGSVSVTSATFNVTTNNGTVIENFTNGLSNYYYVGNSYPLVGIASYAAHPGTASEGLVDEGDGNWYFRQDSGAVITPGSTVSVWVQLSGAANGRAYFGFGTNYPSGLDSVVLAPNTNQFIIQNNAGFESFTNLAAVTQTYTANTWYLMQVQWGTSGKVIADLYASNGTTLLNSVTAATGDTTAGTFAFRATGSNKYFSTVTDTPGVNNFVVQPPTGGSKGGQGSSPGISSGSTEENPWLWFPVSQPGQKESAAGKLWFVTVEQLQLSEEGGLFLF